MKAKFINENFKEKSDPIKDMGIGIDANTIQGFLELQGFDNIKIYRRPGRLSAVYVNFEKDNVKFEFSMVTDDDTASTRHSLEWQNSKGFDYQPSRWTLADAWDEKETVSILKRRLKKYYKQQS